MRKFKYYYLVIAIFILFCIFSLNDTFVGIENNMKDITYQSKSPVDPNIIIIAIDDKSLANIGRFPWTRDKYAQLIEKLSKGKPAVIASDILFSEKTDRPEDDKLLIDAVRNAGNVVMPVKGDFNRKNTEKTIKAISLTESIEGLKEVSIPGHINVFQDENDGVVRKSLNSYQYNGKTVKSLDVVACELYLKAKGKSPDSINLLQDVTNQSNISFAGRHLDFEHHSFSDVLNGKIPADYFEGKIILIGPYAVAVTDDRFTTAIDYQEPLFGIEVHANIIQNILHNKFKQEIPGFVNILILALFCILVPFAFKKFGPMKSAILLALVIIIYTFASKSIYNKGYILQLFYPAAIIAILYAAMLIYRYIEELLERKRVTDVFGRYVAPQVVSSILEGGEEGLKLGGTRREITALFVDIRGFTPMSEKCQPEEVVEILNDYLHLCAMSIFQFGGTLDKFIGDATMAIFNAPLDLDDHEFRAVQTAWAMKQGSYELAEKLEKKFGRSVQFGIGVNTGFAVVGNIGAKFRMDYTAIGDTVNTAARLESNSKPGQILLSQSTYERVKDRIEATFLGEIKVKGKEMGVPIYQLDGIKAV